MQEEFPARGAVATQKRYQRHRTCAGERSYQAYGLADLQLRWKEMGWLGWLAVMDDGFLCGQQNSI
jgi:hypothetical protein